MPDTTEQLETRIAHLQYTVDELSDVVARQDAELAILSRRVEMLMSREAEREAQMIGADVVSDQPPPHY